MTGFDEDSQPVSIQQELLDVLGRLARLQVFTDRTSKQTSASALWDEADALTLLAKYGRFRIVGGAGTRMVRGYWPEHDPEIPNAYEKLSGD